VWRSGIGSFSLTYTCYECEIRRLAVLVLVETRKVGEPKPKPPFFVMADPDLD
jgi:hypothetical protein